MAGSVVPGLKHAENTEPDKGEKIPGPDQHQAQHAKTDDAKKLIDDGIPVMPLPFLPAKKAN